MTHWSHPGAIHRSARMPRLDGYGAAREIRQDPRGQRVKIIALTGWGQEDDRERARDATRTS